MRASTRTAPEVFERKRVSMGRRPRSRLATVLLAILPAVSPAGGRLNAAQPCSAGSQARALSDHLGSTFVGELVPGTSGRLTIS